MKRFFKRVKRVIDFLPIIWKGQDYDYRYALELFQFQLKRLATTIEANDLIEDAKNVSSRINTAVKLIDKVYDDEYIMESFDKFDKLYGKPEFRFVETGEIDKNGEKLYSLELHNPVVLDGMDQEDLNNIRNQMLDESIIKSKRAEKLLWNFISHNISKWWD